MLCYLTFTSIRYGHMFLRGYQPPSGIFGSGYWYSVERRVSNGACFLGGDELFASSLVVA